MNPKNSFPNETPPNKPFPMKHFVFLPALLLVTALQANDIQVTNATFTGVNTVDATMQVQFDITWATSWRSSSVAPNNWDAAWVFVKYRNANTGLWQHARLGSDAQHNAPSGSTIATGLRTPGTAYDAATNWGVGAFIHRSDDGFGTFTANGVELRWNYGQNGITFNDIDEVKVFAVEMVYVPEGAFSVGSGGAETWPLRNGPTNTPFLITSEDAIPLGTGAGQLWSTGNIASGTLPAAFPKGFRGFYVMKYSITQQQYVDFLNTLTRTQQNTRTGTSISNSATSVGNRYVMMNRTTLDWRNGIRCDANVAANVPITFYCDLNGNGTGGETDDGQWVACDWLSWYDVGAYLDWSGLRFMTELEYEKACRGPLAPVPNEYAWGNASVRTGNYTGSNLGTITEGVGNPSTGATGNALHSSSRLPGTPGPGRVGLFAGAATTRANAGASYYGVMELSGNVFETVVNLFRADGVAYTGLLGDGALNATGDYNQANWPPQPAQFSTDANGGGWRGGSSERTEPELRVSDRSLNAAAASTRSPGQGGRGCRMVP